MKVLVAGAAGGVGEGIVRALLERTNAVVIATSRSEARLDLLRARLGDCAGTDRLIEIAGDAGHARGAAAIADAVRDRVGTLDVAIPSLGGWWEGSLLDTEQPVWDAVMHEMLDTHFVFARTFVPELARRPGGWYLAIGGGAALTPVRNSSIVSIAGAAQAMLTRALALETEGSGVRINELIINGPVRTRDSEAIAAADWITADDAGVVVAELIAYGRTTWPAMRTRGPLLIMDARRRPR